MRRLQIFFVLTIAAILVLGACNLGVAAPPATEAPVEPSQPPAETEPPVLTEVPIEPVASPTIIPIDLSGPPMEGAFRRHSILGEAGRIPGKAHRGAQIIVAR